MNPPKVLSELLIAIFFLLYGIFVFVPVSFGGVILGILALAIGILKFIGR